MEVGVKLTVLIDGVMIEPMQGSERDMGRMEEGLDLQFSSTVHLQVQLKSKDKNRNLIEWTVRQN
jgi:hypothetical protein